MEQEQNFWLIGGDRRQRALARLLREDGHTVHTAALEGEGEEPLGRGLSLAHCVLLPLPVQNREGYLNAPLSSDRIRVEEVLDWMEPGQLLCGGMVPPEVRTAGENRGLRVFDYYAREECMVANAVPTVFPIGRTLWESRQM